MTATEGTEAVGARIAAARLWAAHQAPYLASALFALNPVILDAGPVADPRFRGFPADTRWNVYVEPGRALATPVEEIGWWLLHQVGHLVRGHADRSPTGDDAGHRWNQAADAEINDDLEADDLAGPAGVVSPAGLGLPANRTAEEYVPMLDVLADALGRGGGALVEAIDCGSAVDGRERPYEDGGGLGRLDRELLERSLAAAIQERAAARGDVPAGWRRWAEDRTRPAVDWRARLGAVIRLGLRTVAGQVDFSYRRPSRRAGAYGDVVPPSLVRRVPETVLVIDTSGSVGDDVLSRLLVEVTGIVRAVAGPGRRLRALCCDARPYPVQEVRRASDIALVGGGGTDMRAGLAAAAALRPRPDLVVVLTDGDTPWPERRPAAHVVACLIGAGGTAPDWAAVARVPAGAS